MPWRSTHGLLGVFYRSVPEEYVRGEERGVNLAYVPETLSGSLESAPAVVGSSSGCSRNAVRIRCGMDLDAFILVERPKANVL